ncbi:MAG: nucleotidyltransferase family protein [Pseudomonadota bacterium]
MKAMILAAGRGLRMRPLTDEIPKPLLPIVGRPFIAHQLLKLADAGIQDIVINVSYRAKQIIEALKNGHRYGVNIEYSFEPTALETGGGICQALPLLGSDPFIVLSADIYTNYPIEKLACQTLDSLQGTQAHLILVDNPSFHPKGDFHLLPNDLLTLTGSPKLTFASFAIFRPTLFENYIPKHVSPDVQQHHILKGEGYKSESFPLSAVLYKGINEEKVTGEYYQDGIWFNVGTLNELQRLEHYLKQKI